MPPRGSRLTALCLGALVAAATRVTASALAGLEKAGVAVGAGIEEFRKSWQRPKRHVLVQEAVGGDAVPT